MELLTNKSRFISAHDCKALVNPCEAMLRLSELVELTMKLQSHPKSQLTKES